MNILVVFHKFCSNTCSWIKVYLLSDFFFFKHQFLCEVGQVDKMLHIKNFQ